jgi:L-fuculose-phosphate aldolase
MTNHLQYEINNASQELVKVAKLCYQKGYNVSLDGNFSFRLSDGTFLLTPSAIHKGFIEKEQLLIVDSYGNVLKGCGKPSSEFAMHVHIYAKRKDVFSIMHVHSPYAIAASIADIDLLKTYVTVAPVPTTKYARIASSKSAAVIDPFLKEYNWAIIPRHGVVTWADSIWNAFLRIEGLEHFAKILLLAHSTGKSIQTLNQNDRNDLMNYWGITE